MKLRDTPFILLARVSLRQNWRRLKDLRDNSKLLVSVIALFLAGYFLFSFLLFYKGLQFISKFPGLDTLLTERLLYLLFAFLFVLLLLSNLVIAYTNLFRSRETVYLLQLPLPRETVFQWKLLESGLLASWAFLFLIAPLLAAYGMTTGANWKFYLMTVGLVCMFVVLPSVLGAFAAVQIARFLDRKSFQISCVAAALAGLALAAFWLRPEPVTDEMLEARVISVLDKLLAKTSFAQFPLLPSYWLSATVLNYTDGAWRTSLFFALVLLANTLFFGVVGAAWLGSQFFAASSAVHSRGAAMGRWEWFRNRESRRNKTALSPGWFERAWNRAPLLPPDRRALMLKDARVFWRDTTQWGQTLVLFGLLAAYMLNLRHFSKQLTNPFWLNIVSYLNLGACCLNLATLTTRFVYPQFSLEGKRVWIVGMAPLGLRKVIFTKFTLTAAVSLLVTLPLVWISCAMLKLETERTVFFSYAVVVMALTLNSMAMGLGVLYPNFTEDNPGKIVSGFGGTFCLVLSFLYILASIIALVYGAPWARNGTQPLWLLATAWGIFGLLSLAAGWWPFMAGLRKFKTLEL